MVTDPVAPPSLESNWTSRGESQTSALVQVSRAPASQNIHAPPTTGVREAPRHEIAGRKGLGFGAAIYGDLRRASVCFREVGTTDTLDRRPARSACRARQRSSRAALSASMACGTDVRKFAREYFTRASTLPLSFPFPGRPKRS
jgi:hypothetical protein